MTELNETDIGAISTVEEGRAVAMRLWNELQEKQRLIDKICEMEKNRWKSAVKAFGIKPITESEAGR